MKKSLLAVLFAVALVVPAVAENMWIGGSLGFGTSNPKDGDSTSNYYIEPEFGYSVDEKLDIGIDLEYKYDEEGAVFDDGINPPVNYVEKTTTFGIAPFVRYKMFSIGSFDFLAKGSIFYENSKIDKADLKYTTYGIAVVPVVTYSINETWSIGATLDFARIAFENEKCDDNDYENTSFGFDANDGELFSIGFSYHF